MLFCGKLLVLFTMLVSIFCMKIIAAPNTQDRKFIAVQNDEFFNQKIHPNNSSSNNSNSSISNNLLLKRDIPITIIQTNGTETKCTFSFFLDDINDPTEQTGSFCISYTISMEGCHQLLEKVITMIDEQRILTMSLFNGVHYRLANNWYSYVNVNDYENIPINYLEIGCFYGGNVLTVANTYAFHNDSKLYCVDPWDDYKGYSEYKGRQLEIYNSFINNIEKSGKKEKINTRRGYSNIEVLKFDNDFFDIIYIDGNHEPEYVLEDAVLSFRKLKKGGIMIFDDYGWGGRDMTQRGIDAFLSGYHRRFLFLGEKDTQIFIQKIRD